MNGMEWKIAQGAYLASLQYYCVYLDFGACGGACDINLLTSDISTIKRTILIKSKTSIAKTKTRNFDLFSFNHDLSHFDEV